MLKPEDVMMSIYDDIYHNLYFVTIIYIFDLGYVSNQGKIRPSKKESINY